VRVFLTGSTGFVGRTVGERLLAAGHHVTASLRRGAAVPPGMTPWITPDLRGPYDWAGALDGIDAVLHLAGRVHVTDGTAADTTAAFEAVNVAATRRLAEAAIRAGVRRLVLLSTVKVNGDGTPGRPFTEGDHPAPTDAYARSKQRGEQALLETASGTALETVIVRPPLVYGPRVRANFLRLIELCDSGLPLPFGGLDNRRSLIGAGNLADALLRCLEHPAAAGRTFLVRDAEDASMVDLIRAIARALGRPSRLITVPPATLRAVGRALRITEALQRLTEPLQIEDHLIRRTLGWTPPDSVDAGLAATAAWYRARPGSPPTPRPALPAPTGGGLSAVVVSYHTGPLLQDSLHRVLADPAVRELIVVDNGNAPDTLAELRALAAADARLRVISGHGNLGFSAGCNIGASYATQPYLLLLNPDCLIEPGTLGPLVALHAGRTEPWIATPRIVDPDGREQRGGRRNHATPLSCLLEAMPVWPLVRAGGPLRRINLNTEPLPDAPVRVPAISGAFMLMPTATFDLLGGMDERYFLHFEDLDFCLRLARAGGTAHFVPSVTCTHFQGTSAVAALTVERYKARGLWRYLFKNFAPSHPRPALFAVWSLLAAGMIAKGAMRTAMAGRAAPPGAHLPSGATAE